MLEPGSIEKYYGCTKPESVTGKFMIWFIDFSQIEAGKNMGKVTERNNSNNNNKIMKKRIETSVKILTSLIYLTVHFAPFSNCSRYNMNLQRFQTLYLFYIYACRAFTPNSDRIETVKLTIMGNGADCLRLTI